MASPPLATPDATAARLRPPDRHIVSMIIMTDTLSQWKAEYVVWQTGDPSNFDCY